MSHVQEQVQEQSSLLKAIVAGIGGINKCDHTKKAMQRCMTNRVMAGINFSGKKNKFPFGHSNFFKVIKDVMMSRYSCTEKEVTDSIVNYLKWAPERKDGGGRK
ncbi:uncharacterized protein LOC112041349 [Lingula anatina]|uniref:Uncharacterized protein LOC112041349 n=1 Tax=Lingula anatina TaxID=7574 RepID=A0A2R2MIX5_LINAN|nr:uncharacterized protein LOC112041349 [Lingula anatina]|eukprot:XP_023930176.1 uncharacterized protein LOC112041349 [Lingula anatina]